MLPKPILLSREQIDAPSWDQFISQSRECVLYALSWYLDIVCEDWQALVWPSAESPAIVMPLPVRRKFGRRVLYQPLFCQYLGIFSSHDLNAAQCTAFLQALSRHFTYISGYTCNPGNFTPMQLALAGNSGFDFEVFQTHWLDLSQNYQAVRSGYSKDRKSNLKRIAQWQLIKSDDFGPLTALFAAHHAPGIGKIHPAAYDTLTRLGTQCIRRGLGSLMYAQADGRICAGIMLTRYRGRAIYLFNAADRAGRWGNARLAMLDAYFSQNAGITDVFDFESPQKESIARYYAGFGAMAMPFCCIKRNALPAPVRQLQNFRKWFLLKTRQYPFSALCRILNPFRASRF